MYFTEDVIADMAGFIPLSVIGERILSEFSSEQFGHFKSSLVSLLGAYSYELSILQVISDLQVTSRPYMRRCDYRQIF